MDRCVPGEGEAVGVRSGRACVRIVWRRVENERRRPASIDRHGHGARDRACGTGRMRARVTHCTPINLATAGYARLHRGEYSHPDPVQVFNYPVVNKSNNKQPGVRVRTSN